MRKKKIYKCFYYQNGEKRKTMAFGTSLRQAKRSMRHYIVELFDYSLTAETIEYNKPRKRNYGIDCKYYVYKRWYHRHSTRPRNPRKH